MTEGAAASIPESDDANHRSREHRARRLRRHGRRAYIRSVYFLPSMATLGNAICGFASMYVAALDHNFSVAAYLIFVAMAFDAIDGRLARFTRHTTDFGGQLDSLADVISFGVAPAFVSLLLIKSAYVGGVEQLDLPPALSRLIWAFGALYLSCAALRLARFNVSNEHGEQHHFSFLGLPSPAAGGTVAAWILMQQDLHFSSLDYSGWKATTLGDLSAFCIIALPVIILMTGLLMVSHIRYPHLVNQYLRGKRSMGRLIFVLVGVLVLIIKHQYAMAIGMMIYVLLGLFSALNRMRKRHAGAAPIANG